MDEIAAAKALLNPQRLAVGKSEGIQPALVVEARGIHQQRIVFPFPNRVSQLCWLRIGGKLASIHIHLTVRVVHFIQHHDQSRRLNDLDRSKREDVASRRRIASPPQSKVV